MGLTQLSGDELALLVRLEDLVHDAWRGWERERERERELAGRQVHSLSGKMVMYIDLPI